MLSSFRRNKWGSGKTAQQLEEPTAVAEDQTSFSAPISHSLL